jgi:cell wall-associated NlpC family hydrolase
VTSAGQFVLPSIDDYLRQGVFPTVVEGPPPNWSERFVPNFSEWQEGDVVLVGARGTIGFFIFAGQWFVSGQPAASCKWSHCAIYAGRGEIIDAVPGAGVTRRSLLQYCNHRAISLRRGRVGHQMLMPSADGHAIVLAAQKAIGSAYHTADLWRLAGYWLRRRGPQFVQSTLARRYFCSGLVVQAYASVGLRLDGKGYRPCLPATFDSHAALVPVPIEWRLAV